MGPSVRTPNTTAHFVSVDGGVEAAAAAAAAVRGGGNDRGEPGDAGETGGGGEGRGRGSGYGKWERELAKRPRLSAPLHEVTRSARAEFGYGEVGGAPGQGEAVRCPARTREECMRVKLDGVRRGAYEWVDGACAHLAHVSVVREPYPGRERERGARDAIVRPSTR